MVVSHKMIVGLGKTGLSVARYLQGKGVTFEVADSNEAPDALPALRDIAPDAKLVPLYDDALTGAEEIVLSPGVPLRHPSIQRAINAGVPVTGDVAMFGELAERPIVAITGSNGKSTVTALVGALAEACGVRAGVGGNIGTPCLDLLAEDVDLYALEVSSYQLEVATALPSEVAVVLNLSPDHLDRYDSVDDYYATKAAIYHEARQAVVNRDVDYPFRFRPGARIHSFGSDEPRCESSFGLRDGHLARGGLNLMATSELPIRGRHNHLNALAALAIGSALDWDLPSMLDGLRHFRGLPHRCEVVPSSGDRVYINDSKSTNVESTIAAVLGIAPETDNLTLILGGISKGADFSRLADVIAGHVERVLVYGRDRATISTQLLGTADLETFETLDQVVERIQLAKRHDEWVLFSPACASLDQFRNFEARGERFRALVSGGAS